MTGRTVGHEIAEQTAEELAGKDFIADAEMAENHKGPYVKAFVRDNVARERLFDQIDQYPCYIDVVMVDG